MNLDIKDINMLRLYAKDQLIKNLGSQVMQWDDETWHIIVHGKLEELLKDVTPWRMMRIHEIYER